MVLQDGGNNRMLQGTLTYLDEDFGQVKLGVIAKDSFDSLKLYLQNNDLSSIANYQNVMNIYDKLVTIEPDEFGVPQRSVSVQYQDVNPSENRRLDIQKASKFKTNITNREFGARISALLRFAQTETKKNYNSGISSGDDYFSTTRTVTIDNVGYIKYDMSLISELAIQSKYVQLTLREVGDSLIESGLFKELKEKNNYGHVISTTPISNVAFHLTSELLGFPYVPPMIREPANLFGMYETIEEVIEAHPDKNTDWILAKDYHIVSNDTLEEVMAMFFAHDGYLAFDSETTGLKINFKSRTGEADQLVGIVLSIGKGTGYYFPLQHKAFENLCGGDHWYFMEKYMKPLLEKKKVICHNLQYDWKVAYIYNINVNVVYDTMLAFGVTKRYEDPSFKYGLKALAKNLLGLDMFDLGDFVMGGSFGDSDITFADLPYELVRRYAPADADITLTIFEYIEHHAILDKYKAHEVFEMEVNFAKAVAYSEFYGYHININNIPKMEEEIIGGMEKYKKLMFDIAGEEFNPNSPKQLLNIMHEVLGIEYISEDKPSTNKETLKALGDKVDANGDPKYPFVNMLLKYRENESIYKNFLKRLSEFATEDGFIFPEVQQLGTNTGRSSIKNPNYQGYNDPVKKNVSPRAGFFHFDCDFSQIEYRVLASMAQQEQLMLEFDDADLDYHTYQASRMFNIPYSLVPKSLRQQSKGINFGLPYGMGDNSLGARIFGERNKENERKAGALRRKFFQGQEKIEQFFELVRSEGVANGYTVTHFGRRRYYQKSKFSENEIRRQAGNHVIQGCLDGDTRIQTKEYGITKIKNVVGNNLQVWDGAEWTKGDITYSGKKRKCIVRFSGGLEMVCSPIHKFLVVSPGGNKRFVDCQDLTTVESGKNPHRVVINTNYEKSDWEYMSDDKYRGISFGKGANNACLEDIADSFGIGVFLGRLASDGSYALREDGGSYLTHFIAEGESNILPTLEKYLGNLKYTKKEDALREGGTQKMTKLSMYSKSLVSEVTDLDIKHSVHDNIFMDTEVLRGFLSGFYDGDGGVSGKTITLVFGKQFDFGQMCLDIQKALLFFGVRSNYREYDDRFVVQIKTNDNERFLDVIGFLNEDKQNKGRQLECKTKEVTFGPSLVVQSVEITDEYIDMYDVCNTERGYYVADGVITHNTAADVYKISCNRMFNRIVDENWLGLVMLNGFIHDELLMEVHKSINPYYFFKAWREEFELAIDGFCKLFAGAGVGYHWYSAKKQDLPPQFIEVIIQKYNENPNMEWDEDFDKFLVDMDKAYDDYKIRRVKEYVVEPANAGEIIKPIVYALMVEKVDDAIKALQESQTGYTDLENLKEKLGEELVFAEGKHKIKTLKQYLTVFDYFYKIEGVIVDVKSADEVAANTPSSDEELEIKPLSFNDDTYTIGDMVDMRGYFQDDHNDIIYFKDMEFTYDRLPTTMINYLYQNGYFEQAGKYQIALYDTATKDSTLYNAYMSETNFQRMVNLYNSINRQKMQFTPLAY